MPWFQLWHVILFIYMAACISTILIKGLAIWRHRHRRGPGRWADNWFRCVAIISCAWIFYLLLGVLGDSSLPAEDVLLSQLWAPAALVLLEGLHGVRKW